MNQAEYIRYDGLALAGLVRKKDIRTSELLEMAIAQMQRVQPQINAVCWPTLEDARTRAAAIDDALPQGPFAGVPMLLKDVALSAKGMVLAHGSRLFKDSVGTYDSELTVRLRQAGFNFFGRTTSPEFGANCTTEALVYGGPTRNPWNLALSSGGSSGGAAAAVAAGVIPLAHGSDGGGSIRIPASSCGLFGLKPTRMRNPMGPVSGEGWGGLGVEHMLTRSVRDSAAVLDATHGADPGAPYAAPHFGGSYLRAIETPPQPLRVALVTDSPSGEAVHEDCVAAAEGAARLCESLGHHVTRTKLPECNFEAFGEAMRLIVASGTAQAVQAGSAMLGRRATLDDLEISIFTAVDLALRSSAVDYANAVGMMHRVGRQMGAFMQDYDVILTPTLTALPAPLGRYAADRDYVTHRSDTLRFTAFLPYFNASGQPAMSVPLHWNAQGLPIGVQFVGGLGKEDVLLQLAAQLEMAAPWFEKVSPLAKP